MSSKRDLKMAQQDVNDAVRYLLQEGVVAEHPMYQAISIDELAFLSLHESYAQLQIVMNGLTNLDAPAVARDTSIAAAKAALPGRNTLLREVLATIMFRHHMTRGADGMTTDQIEVRINAQHVQQRHHGSFSSAVSTLEDREFIRDSGDRRLTRSKRKAIVWVPTDKAIKLMKEDKDGEAPKVDTKASVGKRSRNAKPPRVDRTHKRKERGNKSAQGVLELDGVREPVQPPATERRSRRRKSDT